MNWGRGQREVRGTCILTDFLPRNCKGTQVLIKVCPNYTEFTSQRWAGIIDTAIIYLEIGMELWREMQAVLLSCMMYFEIEKIFKRNSSLFIHQISGIFGLANAFCQLGSSLSGALRIRRVSDGKLFLQWRLIKTYFCSLQDKGMTSTPRQPFYSLCFCWLCWRQWKYLSSHSVAGAICGEYMAWCRCGQTMQITHTPCVACLAVASACQVVLPKKVKWGGEQPNFDADFDTFGLAFHLCCGCRLF